MSSSDHRPLGAKALFALGALAAIPRLLNLRNSSMWLDEVIVTREASGSLRELWQILQQETYPPLNALLTWLLLHAGASEIARRCVAATLGVATIVLVARWAGRHFGSTTGWLFGLLAAATPIHIHYSQELRAYSLALFLMALALCSFDWTLRTGRRRAWLLLGVALLGCLYSLYFSAVILLVVLVYAVEAFWARDPRLRPAARRTLLRLPLLATALVVAYLPWLGTAWRTRQHPSRSILGAPDWDLGMALRRFEHLTSGGLEGDGSTWRVWLPLVLVSVGAVAAAFRYPGRAVLTGAMAGTVGVELLLQRVDHWSSDRYNLVGWPFLCLLMALGLSWIGSLSRLGRAARVVTVALLLGQIGMQLPGIDRYYERGRPDWRWVARAVAALAQPGDRIVTANPHTHICFGHYWDELRDDSATRPLEYRSTTPRHLAGAPGCAFLVAGGWPAPAPVIRALSAQARLLTDPAGQGIHVYRLTPFSEDRQCVWMVPQKLRWRPDRGLLGLSAPAEPRELSLDFENGSTAPHLLAGWSRFEANAAGDTWVWTVGREAFLALGGLSPLARRLTLELWTLKMPSGPQELAVRLNDTPLGEFELAPGDATVTVDIAPERWRSEENVLSFRFARTAIPAELDPGSADDRPLAAAFHHLDLQPQPEG